MGYYIAEGANESGYHGVPQDTPYNGSVELPDTLLEDYLDAKGYVYPTVENGVVTYLEVNQEALDKYNAEHPDTPDVEAQIAELKANLADTDYQAIKYAEGWLTDEEYEPIKEQRQAWRDEINELEAMNDA